jgi:hypothetical protein
VASVLRRHASQLSYLLLDSGHHARVLMPQVGEHQLRGEVKVLLAVVVIETGTFAAQDWDGVIGGLCTPAVKDRLSVGSYHTGVCQSLLFTSSTGHF